MSMKGPMGSEVGDTHLKPSGRSQPGCNIALPSSYQADSLLVETSKGAVYTAFVAPSRPKDESATNGPTDGPTEGHTLI